MTLLPNMRLLGLPSAQDGRDWSALVKQIDARAEAEKFDLAEESIVIEFRKGEAMVYRPVIGGIRELPEPWILTDRNASRVELRTVESEFWDDILDEMGERDFTLMVKRRMNRKEELSVEVFSFF